MCDFQPGEEIICVKPDVQGVLRKDKTYIVYDVYLDSSGYYWVNVNITVNEERALIGEQRTGWFPWRFRRPMQDEEGFKKACTISRLSGMLRKLEDA